MRARKVVILLALAALSALTLFLVVLVDGEALGATVSGTESSPQWKGIGPGGKANVEVLAFLGEGGSGDLRLPLISGSVSDFTIPPGPRFWDAAGMVENLQEGK